METRLFRHPVDGLLRYEQMTLVPAPFPEHRIVMLLPSTLPSALTSRPLRLTRDGTLDAPELLGDPRVSRMMALLNHDGEETRIVGGAVRNALLGLPAGDIDLATTALPEAVMARAKRAKLRTIPTGLAHGTVTVLDTGMPFEVTTLREDVETDGRHAVVRFGRDFEQDAQRRDFTVNALSVGPDGTLYDTTDGVGDLAGGRIRFIGDAATRIREDYLRILRFFRFHATYGIGALDPAGLAAAIACRSGLDGLSRERVRAEVLKLLAAPGTTALLETLQQHGFLEQILGAEADVPRLARLIAQEGDAADSLLRLGALGGSERGAGRDAAKQLALVQCGARSSGRRGIGPGSVRRGTASANTSRASRDPLRSRSRPHSGWLRPGARILTGRRRLGGSARAGHR